MNDGKPHPLAQSPVLPCTFKFEPCFEECQILITRSRLVLCLDTPNITAHLIVWDWITGNILLVRTVTLFYPLPMQIVHLGARGRGPMLLDIY
jgi:hypothetical protein